MCQSRISKRAQNICIELESRSWRGVLDTTLCEKVSVSNLWQVVDFPRVRRFHP